MSLNLIVFFVFLHCIYKKNIHKCRVKLCLLKKHIGKQIPKYYVEGISATHQKHMLQLVRCVSQLQSMNKRRILHRVQSAGRNQGLYVDRYSEYYIEYNRLDEIKVYMWTVTANTT